MRGERNVFVNDSVGTTLVEGLLRKLVAVERLAFQGDEDAPLGAVAAVGRDDGVLLIELV